MVYRTPMFRLASTVLACLFIFAGLVSAQSATATLNGTVHDSAGASMPDANISIQNQGTGISLESKSTSDGNFSFTGLASGTYTVTISKPGFASYAEKDIFLGPTVVRSVNASLNVGQVNSQVTVEASGAQVQTETSQLSNSVTQEQVETLPLNGRNYQSLSALMPGVVNLQVGNSSAEGQGGFNTSNLMSINGMGQNGTLYVGRRLEHEYRQYDANDHLAESGQHHGSAYSAEQLHAQIFTPGILDRSCGDAQWHA